jgi:parallel beta-helix repeat protein
MEPRTSRLLAASSLVLLPAMAAWPRPAHADTQACTVIDTLPTTITESGHYCLEQDFAVDYAGASIIQINVDDVVLDCNDHVIRATNNANTLTAIYGNTQRRNVEVRNCIVDNFYVGIFFTASTEPGAVGNRVLGNTVRRTSVTSIYVIGSNNLIEGNRIVQTTASYSGGAKGIFLYSPGAQGVGNVIRDNVIQDWRPTPPADGNSIEGITFFNVRDTEVTGNTISGLHANTGWGVWGIYASQTSNNLIAGNTILSPPPAAAPLDGGQYGGIRVFGTVEEQATTVCRDNVVGHFNTDILGCVMDGNTEF